MPPNSTRACVTEIFTRITRIEARLDSHAKLLERYIEEERLTHNDINAAIKRIHGLALRVGGFALVTLLGLVVWLLINDRPWDIQ